MSRKVKLGTQRKNEERKKQALKINKIGRPSKVKWLELAPGSLKGTVSLPPCWVDQSSSLCKLKKEERSHLICPLALTKHPLKNVKEKRNE